MECRCRLDAGVSHRLDLTVTHAPERKTEKQSTAGKQNPQVQTLTDPNITPPSTSVSWFSTGFVWVVVMEHSEELQVKDVSAGNPRLVLRTVPLQLDQVLPPITTSTNNQDLPDCLGRHAIDDLGWRGVHQCRQQVRQSVGPASSTPPGVEAPWTKARPSVQLGRREQKSSNTLPLFFSGDGNSRSNSPWRREPRRTNAIPGR